MHITCSETFPNIEVLNSSFWKSLSLSHLFISYLFQSSVQVANAASAGLLRFFSNARTVSHWGFFPHLIAEAFRWNVSDVFFLQAPLYMLRLLISTGCLWYFRKLFKPHQQHWTPTNQLTDLKTLVWTILDVFSLKLTVIPGVWD